MVRDVVKHLKREEGGPGGGDGGDGRGRADERKREVDGEKEMGRRAMEEEGR